MVKWQKRRKSNLLCREKKEQGGDLRVEHDWLRVRGGAARREDQRPLQNRTQAPAPWLIASSRFRHRPIAPIFAPQGTRDAHSALGLPLILETLPRRQMMIAMKERERCWCMRAENATTGVKKQPRAFINTTTDWKFFKERSCWYDIALQKVRYYREQLDLRWGVLSAYYLFPHNFIEPWHIFFRGEMGFEGKSTFFSSLIQAQCGWCVLTK